MAAAVDGLRRASAPHHHHVQPKYPEPEVRPRRKTEGTVLHRVRSRPEDYKNKPRPANMVEYICFDPQDRPVKCDEEEEEEQRPSTRRRERTSRTKRYDASIDDDDEESSHSEDELKLPSNYRSPSGRRGSRSGSERVNARPEAEPYGRAERRYENPAPPPPPPVVSSSRQRSHSPREQSRHHQSQYLQPIDHRQSVYPDQRRRSWHGPDPDDDYFDKQPITRHNTYNHTEGPYDSRTRQSHHRSNQRTSSPALSSELASGLIAQVAEHLQTHKNAYSNKHGNGSELVNELMGQVVRKVADGSLNGDMMKEIVREVQRVL